MVEEGEFREDLYYRLNVFPIQIPALRERKEDIPTLVRCFLKKLSARLGKKIDSVSTSVIATLQDYGWPGNVRELENVIERAMILTSGSSLKLPSGVIPTRKHKSHQASIRPLSEVEAEHIRTVLEHTNGVIAGKSGAAKILEINANTLRSRMEKLGIKVERTDGS